jgi:hypothetical protein
MRSPHGRCQTVRVEHWAGQRCGIVGLAFAGQGLRQTTGADPEKFADGQACYGNLAEVILCFGVEYADARLHGGAGVCVICNGALGVQGRDQIAGDRGPIARQVAGVLAATAHRPTLVGKGRAEYGVVPEASSHAGGQFRDSRAAQQAVDLLVGDVGAGDQRRQSGDYTGRVPGGAFARAAVDCRRAGRRSSHPF